MVCDALKKIITNSLKQNKLAHCYLLKGEKGVNFDDSILYVINSINNSELISLENENLPFNVLLLGNNSNDWKKDSIIKTLGESNYSSLEEGKLNIFIIKNIEYASKSALNSLLKTIEEPTNDVVFIFTTNNINNVLSTIKSRSILINIPSPSKEELQNEFLKHGFGEVESWFYSYIFNDVNGALNSINKLSFKQIIKLTDAIENSYKSKYFLHLYFSKFNKKESKNDFILLIKCALFIYSWNSIYGLKVPEKFSSLYKKIKSDKIDVNACFNVLQEFIGTINDNLNFFLQAEKTLIKLMRVYD